MDNYKATFRTRNQFNIVGIGLMLTGQVLDGEINYGCHLRFTVNGEEVIYHITAVETIDYISQGFSETALILELQQGDPHKNYLESIAGKETAITT